MLPVIPRNYAKAMASIHLFSVHASQPKSKAGITGEENQNRSYCRDIMLSESVVHSVGQAMAREIFQDSDVLDTSMNTLLFHLVSLQTPVYLGLG